METTKWSISNLKQRCSGQVNIGELTGHRSLSSMELGNLTVTGAGNFSTTLTTPCTACIQNMTNTSMTYTEKNMGYGLSDQELMKALNPGLYFVGTYAYILWYVIGLPANTFAFCVWIQRQVRAKMPRHHTYTYRLYTYTYTYTCMVW